ncbi:hypothetical protein D3C86_1893320 [compost metagenome]
MAPVITIENIQIFQPIAFFISAPAKTRQLTFGIVTLGIGIIHRMLPQITLYFASDQLQPCDERSA